MHTLMSHPLGRELIAELRRSAQLTGSLPVHIYAASEDGAGSIGAHLRHILNFAASFANGVRTGQIDYAKRERDTRIERNQEHAAACTEQLIKDLAGLDLDAMSLVMVRSEVPPFAAMPSSVCREMEFVLSHTIHHLALMKERLSGYGLEMPGELGVAPSTLAYWRTAAMPHQVFSSIAR